MKVRSLLSFCISFTILGAGCLPVFANSQRYPTNAEMQRETDKFRRITPSLQQSGQFGIGRREPALESFVKAWSKVDPVAASFLGTWHGQETDWNIYPSNVKGRVCIIFRSPPKISPGASFALGYASNGQLRANEIVTATGSNRMVFIRQRNYLGIVSVANNNQAGVLPYSAFSDSLKQPIELLSYLPQASKNKIIQGFQAAGCTASLPSDSQIATGRSHSTGGQTSTVARTRQTIESLPDGNYFYGQVSTPKKIGFNYYVFRKTGSTITGLSYNYPGEYDCIRGTAKLNIIANGTGAGQNGTSKWQFFENIKPIALSNFYRLKITEEEAKPLNECIQAFSSRPNTSNQNATVRSTSTRRQNTTRRLPNTQQQNTTKKTPNTNQRTIGNIALASGDTIGDVTVKFDGAYVNNSGTFKAYLVIENRSSRAFGFIPVFAKVEDANGQDVKAEISFNNNKNVVVEQGSTLRGEVFVLGQRWKSSGSQDLFLVIKEGTTGGRTFRVPIGESSIASSNVGRTQTPVKTFTDTKALGMAQLLQGNRELIAAQETLQRAARGDYNSNINAEKIDFLSKDITEIRPVDCKALGFSCERKSISYADYLNLKLKVKSQESVYNKNMSTAYEEIRKYQERLYNDSRYGGRSASDKLTSEFNRILKDIDTRQQPSRLSLPEKFGIALQQTTEDITELSASSFKTSTKVIATIAQFQDIADSIKSLASINQDTLNRIAGSPKYVLAVQEILKDAGQAFLSFDNEKLLDANLKAAQETIELINSQDKRVAGSSNAIKAYSAAKELLDKNKLLRQSQVTDALDNFDKFYLAAAQFSKTIDVIIAGLSIPFSEVKVIDSLVKKADAVNTLLFDALEFTYKSDIRRKYVKLQYAYNRNQIAISGLSSFIDYSAEEVGKYLLKTRTDVVTRRPNGSIAVSVDGVLYPP